MPITDLTGTKWEFNNVLSIATTLNGVAYNIDFNSFGNSYGILSFVSASFPFEEVMRYRVDSDSAPTQVYYNRTKTPNVWVNEDYKIIDINGGSDATNSDLISWLQANATQIEEQSNPISIGDLPIANMYFGTQQVKKVYLGNTLVWEKEETGYNVSITFSNCSSYSIPYLVFDTGTIDKETLQCNFSSSNQIGSLASANGTINVSTTTGKIYIVAGGAGSFISYGTVNYSGGITEDFKEFNASADYVLIDNQPYSSGMVTILECSVNADGTITIDGFDWDD